MPHPGPGCLPVASDRPDVEIAGVFASVASVAVSCVCKFVFWNLVTEMLESISEQDRVIGNPLSLYIYIYIRFMDITKQHMVRFSVWVRFLKYVLPQGLEKTNSPNLQQSQNVWILLFVPWLHLFPYASSMQQTPQMHLNTPPTCLEGVGGRQISFRDPGSGNRAEDPGPEKVDPSKTWYCN